MLPVCAVGDKILQWLVEIDEATCKRVAAGGCRWCDGPLHRSDYPRKPRGGLLAAIGEVFFWRLSLCCGREGCRRRATPPSVRFLGRRVYLGAAVILGSIASQALATAREVKRVTGIPARTVGRWRLWWQTQFTESRLFEEQRGRFIPPLVIAELPAALVERFDLLAGRIGCAAQDKAHALLRTLGFVSPLTTSSVVDGARFVRVE
jgi:hypothetical protein